jgi:hypothetical protein
MNVTNPDPAKFAVTVRIPWLVDDNHWEYIKRELIRRYMSELFPPMIGDGLHHVMKFDYYKSEPGPFDEVEYSLICRHSIAQMQNVTFYQAENIDRYIRAANLKPVCRFCGNTLKLDKRGGCSACGGPGNGEGLQS